jgi:hypothetical protein
MTSFIPHNVGNYIFVTPIQDLLWIGNDTSSDANVLIRVIERDPTTGTPPDFVSGIAALKCLQPPFARLRDVIEEVSFIYVISDQPAPRSLRAFVEEHGPVSEATAKVFTCHFIDVARRYAEATSAPFVVTYDQLFVNGEGVLEQVFVSTQLPANDLAFRAPELLSDHGGPETVIWCAAVFVYYLTVGKLPFTAVGEQELAKQIVRTQPEIPRTLSPELIVLLIKMFAKNPMARIGLERLGKDPWMAVPEAERAIFVERRRSLNRLLIQAPQPEAPQDDSDAAKRVMKGVRLMPRRMATMRFAGAAKTTGPGSPVAKAAFPHFG